MNEDVYVEWITLTHEDKPKSLEWYRYVLYVGAVVFVVSVIIGNFLFALFTLFAVGVLFLVASKKPEKERYALTTRGARIGTVLYPREDFYAYSVHDENREFPLLVIRSAKTFAPHISLPLGETDHEPVREYFRIHRIREVPHEPSFTDWVAEQIGF